VSRLLTNLCVRLLDKGIQCPTQCVSCDSNHEDLAHIFFECPFAVHVLSMAGMWHEIHNVVVTSPSTAEAIFSLLHSLSVTLSQQMAALLWSLWKHRNVKVWEDILETCATVVDRARSMV